MRRDHGQRVRGTLDFHIRIGAVFQQEPDDLDVPAANRRMQRVATRRDAFLRQIRIRAALQEQPNDLNVSTAGSVAQWCARTGVVGDVARRAVGQRRILIAQFPNAV